MKHTVKKPLQALAIIGNIVLLGLAIIVCLSFASRSSLNNIGWEEDSYIVEKGDTLWEIGKIYCPDSVDIRDWVHEVQKLNDLKDGLIYPYDELIILVPIE